jgi:TRAP transporter TAXI family solute receptor
LIPASPGCKSLHEGYMAFGGVTWDDVKIVQVSSWGAAWNAVIDGSADTAHCLINSAKAVELSASPSGIHWLPAPADNKEGWGILNKYCPYLRPYTATSGAGASPENPVHIASYYYGLVCYPNLDEEVVYKITRGIWNSYENYSSKHPTLKLWTREGALKTDSFLSPYHPGAVKFFKEAGVWTAEHEKVQSKLLQEEAARMKK